MQFVRGSAAPGAFGADGDRLVASVFRDVRGRLPVVPAFLEALAVEPPALLEAWLQTRALFDDPRARASARRLLEAADPGLSYRASRAVRDAVQPFRDTLPGLLLAVASLGLSLDGALPRRPLPPAAFPPDDGVPPPARAPAAGDEPALFGEIRRVYGVDHVPSMYRSLAARDLLAGPWRALRPYLEGAAGRERTGALGALADREAQRYPEVAFLGNEAARPVVAVFRKALPLNLVFASACASR